MGNTRFLSGLFTRPKLVSSTQFFPGRFRVRNAVKRAAILAVDILVHGLN